MNRSDKEKLLKTLMEKKLVVETHRLGLFKPNPGFQTQFQLSKANVRLITAGNQSGKSTIGAVESAMYSLGEHPHKKIRTPNTGLIITGQGFKTGIDQVVFPKLSKIVGSKDIVHIKRSSQGIPVQITWRNGSITHLMSSEQDDDVFEGMTCDHVWIDEPVRRSIFVAVKRGMITTGGHLWLSCTPLDEPWMYEDIYIKGIEKTDPEIEVFEGSTDENVMISEYDKNEFKKILTKEEIDARWYGKFRHLSGRVFKSYAPEKHRISGFDIPYHWPVWISIDPHRGKPHAVIFIAISPQNKKYVCNEIFRECSIGSLAEEILDLASQYNIYNHMIDTSAQEDGWNKMSARQILQEYGISTKLAQKKNKKNSGIMLINQLFEQEDLYIFDHCVRTHRELVNQTYKKQKQADGSFSEEPQKKYDDQTDNMRYILIENPKFGPKARVKEIGPLYQMNTA